MSNLDGGNSSTTGYLPSQMMYGGNASSVFLENQIISGGGANHG